MNTERLRELLGKANLPWFYGIAYEPESGAQSYNYHGQGYSGNPGLLDAKGQTVVGCDEYYVFNTPEESALIVETVNALPALLDTIEKLREALDAMARCACPVATEINPRGYNWSEAYLDQALPIARAALGE